MSKLSLMIQPRLMDAATAAAYLGYKSTAILAQLPFQPIRIASIGANSAPRYDRFEIDKYIDDLIASRENNSDCVKLDDADAIFDAWLENETRAA